MNPLDNAEYVRFSRPAYAALETLAEAMDVTVEEATRRALILLDAYLQLNYDECLAVYKFPEGTVTSLHFAWEPAAQTDGSGAA